MSHSIEKLKAENESMRKTLNWNFYLIIAFIVILSVFGFLFEKNESIKSIYIGVATGLISSFLINFFSKLYKSNANDAIISKIEDIADKMDDTNSKIAQNSENLIKIVTDNNKRLLEEFDVFIQNASSSGIMDENTALRDFFDKLKTDKCNSIIMCGYSMAHIFKNYERKFVELLNNGVNIKVLLVDPESSSGQLMRDKLSREGLEELHPVGEPHFRTLRYIHEIMISCSEKNCKPNITVGKISWIPSTTLVLAANNNNDYFVLLEGINGFMLNNKISRRLYNINQTTLRDMKIDFYESHFKALWKEADNQGNIYSDIIGVLQNKGK